MAEVAFTGGQRGGKAEGQRVARAEKLLEVAIEMHAKTFECIQEARKLLNGESTIGDGLKVVEKLFSSEWDRRYGGGHVWQYAKDRAQWKRLLKASPLDVVQARVLAYFFDADPYLTRARHPFGLFVSRFNNYATEAPAAAFQLQTAPVGCKHDPVCESEQAHTKRITADRRAGR